VEPSTPAERKRSEQTSLRGASQEGVCGVRKNDLTPPWTGY